MLAAVIEQMHHANRIMLSNKRIQKIIVGKQRVLTIGNQQRGLDLLRIRSNLSTLMAEQRKHGRDAKLQQRKERDIQLRHVAQLYQRGFAGFDPLTAQRTGEVIHRLVQFTIAQLALTLDDRRMVAFCMAGQNIRQRQILPVALFAVPTGKFVRPPGERNAHHRSLMQSKNVQHGGKFDAGFTPFPHR
ncbi:hypothetical protein SDC9_122917 [bioreactor metagenome]|uniref:Uncharacterized protein n=1 Tax=bioreactor metagenome TaxID=1076179 RepID=A0A645CGE5_9ZZZZ